MIRKSSQRAAAASTTAAVAAASAAVSCTIQEEQHQANEIFSLLYLGIESADLSSRLKNHARTSKGRYLLVHDDSAETGCASVQLLFEGESRGMFRISLEMADVRTMQSIYAIHPSTHLSI